jgi:hypothetical protein
MNRRRQIIHRTTRSRSTKRKLLTSVWRHSMCSTRKARTPPVTACEWPGVADAAAAAVAEAADAAAAWAGVAVDAGDAGGAARRGADAAGARPDRPLALVDPVIVAGFDEFDPANIFMNFSAFCGAGRAPGWPSARQPDGSPTDREALPGRPDKEFPWSDKSPCTVEPA